MSRSAAPEAAPRRRLWPLFLTFAVVIALVGAWTGVWFYVAAQVKAEIAGWRERERHVGRAQDCASLSVRGYPFRMDVRCAGASLELEGTPSIKLGLASASATVQINNPTLLISEFAGPLNIAERGGQTYYVIDWDRGRSSVSDLPQPDRGSLELDTLSLRDASAPGNDLLFKAQHFELHGHLAPGAPADTPAIETVVQLRQAVAEKIHPMIARPTDVDITSVVRGLDRPSPKTLPLQLKEWQARNGEIEISKARIQQSDVVVEGAGTLRLTARGGLEGNLRVTIIGIGTVLRNFNLEGLMPDALVSAMNILGQWIPGLGGTGRQSPRGDTAGGLGQRSELDGKPAITLPLRFVDGTVFLGPLKLAVVPPLF
jgi:hypothetical protein